jgi:hypothetical protein
MEVATRENAPTRAAALSVTVIVFDLFICFWFKEGTSVSTARIQAALAAGMLARFCAFNLGVWNFLEEPLPCKGRGAGI